MNFVLEVCCGQESTKLSVGFKNSKRMEAIFANPGLDLISTKIVQYLDYCGLTTLSQVSHAFKTFIDSDRSVWKSHVKRLKEIELFPFELWHPICEIVLEMETFEIHQFVDIFQDYLDFGKISGGYDQDIIEFLEASYDYESITFLVKIIEKVNINVAYEIAVELREADVIKSLTFEDININAQDGEGVTLLMLACTKGSYEVVQYMLSNENIDVNVKNVYGNTALDCAQFYKHTSIMELIVHHKLLRDPKGSYKFSSAMEEFGPSFFFKCLNEM